MNFVLVKKDFDSLPYEFVERKGKGHPDTLSDGLAEYLSAQYSMYTKQNYGAVLHHNFDKVGLLGGASDVRFGDGKLTKPIRVLLNGRASTKFGNHDIDVKTLLIDWSKTFLASQLPFKNIEKELEFHYNLSTQSSPGTIGEKENIQKSSRKYWFEPRNLDDVPELKRLFANDTSMGVGFAPYSSLENLIFTIDQSLTCEQFISMNPWIGSDIKIMGFRHKNEYKITICIPQIADQVSSIEIYKENIHAVQKEIYTIFQKLGIEEYELNINTRDNYDKSELYLTAIGSSIESGDEGLVGRGNRVQGIISPMRPMSMEGAAGKNPVYHIGKIYYVAAQKISEAIYKKFNIQNEVVLVSQSGRGLLDPWIVFVHVPNDFLMSDDLEYLVKKEIKNIPLLTDDLIKLKIPIS